MKALGKGSIASIVRGGLQVAWVILWFLAACLVLAAIGYGVILFMVANGLIDPTLLQGGQGQIAGGEHGDFSITYDQPDGGTWPVVVPVLLIGAVAIAGSLVIVWRLRRLFDSFSTGEPFRRENADHLRVIWITMIVIEVARYVLKALVALLVIAFQPEAHVRVAFDLNLMTWGAIFILIVLAEVFREGARLKEEQELTI